MKNKSFLAILLVCIVAITAIVIGTAALRNKSKDETSNLLDLNDAYDRVAMDTEEGTTEDTRTVNADKTTEEDTKKKEEEPTTEKQEKEEKTTGKKNEIQVQAEPSTAKPAGTGVSPLHFSGKDILRWPVEGNVIVEYNMENTIYFKTLNQYKCSPAIAIQAELNEEVCAAAAGEVKEVSTDEEIGNYVVVSLGDGYELTYGQLKDVQVEPGDRIEEKEVIGYVNEPTKYYTKEGYNLYLKLTVNGEPKDPLDYLNY